LVLTALLACAEQQTVEPRTETAAPVAESVPVEEVIAAAQTAAVTEAPVAPTQEITPEPTDTPTPEPTDTPVPTPATVTIGAVGDIMAPSQIVEDVKVSADEYDFMTLFAPFAELFQSVDLMCGNLETPLAGREAGYSVKTGDGALVFNAPDSILDALKAYGMDVLTTANNHCLDKDAAGLYRTIETIRNAGFYQTGTYLDAADCEKPLIIEINGIRIGIVAGTRKPNVSKTKRHITDEESRTVVSYLINGEKITDAAVRDIARAKEAGAEFIIYFAHWDYENDKPAADVTKSLARQLFQAGADCIIGSHPHRVKAAEYVTVNRADGPYTGLVLYSLGNFSANNAFEKMVGLFVKITLEKDFETGKVTLVDAGVLPTLSMRRAGKGQKFTVVPAYADPSKITGLKTPLTETELKTLRKAREHAWKRLGKCEGLRILDEE
jgi:poly-gamma-glutamate synthesis protein (capsule biosynthesis protein)